MDAFKPFPFSLFDVGVILFNTYTITFATIFPFATAIIVRKKSMGHDYNRNLNFLQFSNDT